MSKHTSMNTPAKFFEDRARWLSVTVHDTGTHYELALVIDQREDRDDAEQLAQFYSEWLGQILFCMRENR